MIEIGVDVLNPISRSSWDIGTGQTGWREDVLRKRRTSSGLPHRTCRARQKAEVAQMVKAFNRFDGGFIRAERNDIEMPPERDV
jgi:hypothetical protein